MSIWSIIYPFLPKTWLFITIRNDDRNAYYYCNYTFGILNLCSRFQVENKCGNVGELVIYIRNVEAYKNVGRAKALYKISWNGCGRWDNMHARGHYYMHFMTGPNYEYLKFINSTRKLGQIIYFAEYGITNHFQFFFFFVCACATLYFIKSLENLQKVLSMHISHIML